jgi:hypothetical protein
VPKQAQGCIVCMQGRQCLLVSAPACAVQSAKQQISATSGAGAAVLQDAASLESAPDTPLQRATTLCYQTSASALTTASATPVPKTAAGHTACAA